MEAVKISSWPQVDRIMQIRWTTFSGFPYIFRGALDVRATLNQRGHEAGCCACHCWSCKRTCAGNREPCLQLQKHHFRKRLHHPETTRSRLITTVAPAVAKAAIESGVAQSPITNWSNYVDDLSKRLGLDNKLIALSPAKPSNIRNELSSLKPIIIRFWKLHRSCATKVLHVRFSSVIARRLIDWLKKIILILAIHQSSIHVRKKISDNISENFIPQNVVVAATHFTKPVRSPTNGIITAQWWWKWAKRMLWFRLTRKYGDVIRPAQIIGTQDSVKKVAGMYIMVTKRSGIFADTTVNVQSDSWRSCWDHRAYNMGSSAVQYQTTLLLCYRTQILVHHPKSRRKSERCRCHSAPEISGHDGRRRIANQLCIEPALLSDNYPFCEFANEGANTLIFPSLEAGNIAYKLPREMGRRRSHRSGSFRNEKPVHVLQLGSSVREIRKHGYHCRCGCAVTKFVNSR